MDVLNKLATPTGATVQMVTSSSLHNGVPMAIATLKSTGSIESIVSFYRNRWISRETDRQPGFIESVLPGWQLISRVHDGYNIVVQLTDDESGGSSGFISTMATDKSAVRLDHGEFADLKSLSAHRSVDEVDTSLMRVYASKVSISHTHQIYRQRLLSKGWQLLLDTDVDDASVMILARDRTRLEVSIVASREYGALLVAHQVTSK